MQSMRPSVNLDIEYVSLPRDRMPLEPVAFLSRTADNDGMRARDWVAGIVAKNPFRGLGLHTKQSQIELDVPQALDTSALLICSLQSWHELGDHIDYYYISSFEFLHMYGTTILRPLVDWKSEEFDKLIRKLR